VELFRTDVVNALANGQTGAERTIAGEILFNKALQEMNEQLPENLSRKGFVPIRGFPHSVT
jgi:hypothetical protein